MVVLLVPFSSSLTRSATSMPNLRKPANDSAGRAQQICTVVAADLSVVVVVVVCQTV